MIVTKSKMYQLFSSLSNEELNALKLAVNSPFFNTRKEEVLLFNFLYKYMHDNTKLNNLEILYAYIFGKSNIQISKLRHIMSYLTKIIERVLAFHELEKDSFNSNILLLKNLRKKNLTKQFSEQYQVCLNIDNNSKLSSQKFYYQLQMHSELYSFTMTQRKSMDLNIKDISIDIDLYFITNKLKQACNALSHKNLFDSKFEPELIQEILALIETKNLIEIPLIRLLYFSYKSLNYNENEEFFFNLKKALFEFSTEICSSELKDIFTLAINYCIKKLNTGKNIFIKEVFELYSLGIDLQIFEENGKISPFTFKNITSISIALKEYNWVQNFLNQFENKIDGLYGKDFHTYSLAKYYFALKQYDKVMMLLQEVEIKETFTELDTRVLLIKTYLELDEYDLLDYSISNLKQQIQRKKLQTYHEKVYKNFAKFAKKIASISLSNKPQIQKLIDEIKNKENLAEKSWLEEKLKSYL